MAHEYTLLHSPSLTYPQRRVLLMGSLAILSSIIVFGLFFGVFQWYEVQPMGTTPGSSSGSQSILKGQSPIPEVSTPSTLGTSQLLPGQNLKDVTVLSPSRQYQLRLEDNGNIVLLDLHRNRTLFTSDTAMYLAVSWTATLSETGVLELSWNHPSQKPDHGTVWKSNLLPLCKPIDTARVDSLAFLEITDEGLVQIRSGAEVICTLNRRDPDKGRLAVSMTGYLRTYQNVCDSHMEHIIRKWDGSGGVDVHVFVYDVPSENYIKGTSIDGDEPTEENVHRHLKQCYGDHLKTFALVSEESTAQTVDDVPENVRNLCGTKLGRLLTQYDALYRTGQQIKRYMQQNAVTYDYILRFRPDILVYDAPPLDAMEPGRVRNIRATYDLMYYNLKHDGGRHTGFTDIAGYGRASAMWPYFGIGVGLKDMLADGPLFDWADMLDIDQDLKDLNPSFNRCNAEGLLGHWLTLNGLETETDWRWRMGIMRENGHVSQGFFTCQPWLQANWMCPPETIWEPPY